MRQFLQITFSIFILLFFLACNYSRSTSIRWPSNLPQVRIPAFGDEKQPTPDQPTPDQPTPKLPDQTGYYAIKDAYAFGAYDGGAIDLIWKDEAPNQKYFIYRKQKAPP